MTKNRGYEDLIVWKKAIHLSLTIYKITQSFPKDERYGLISQMRRCAVSVPSNIAEGCARNSCGEFCQFLGIASGSLAELHTQIIIASQLHYVEKETFHEIGQSIDEVRKMLGSLKRSLKNTSPVLATNNSQLVTPA